MARLRATGRQPRGWDEIVSRLLAQRNRDAFCQLILELQCKIVAAEYGILWTRDSNDQSVIAAGWPEKLIAGPSTSPALKLLTEAAEAGFERQLSHVLKIENDRSPDGTSHAHVFVTVMRAAGQVEAISTVVADCHDVQAMQATAPLRELVAGLYASFHAHEDLEAARRDADQVRQAMALLAVSQAAEGFAGAALNLVNELARQGGCTRVSLGWIKGRHVKLVSISHTEHLKRHSEQVAHVELAMAECLDQQQPIVYPLPPNAEPLLAHVVVHDHRRLTADHPDRYVMSVPLRDNEQWLGVLTLERANKSFDAEFVQQLQLIADVLGPHLADRQESDRWLVGHAWHSLKRFAGYAVGPRHVAWKMLAIAMMALIVYAAVGSWPYRVTAEFTFEAHTKRIIPAPFESQLLTVHVEPADQVEAGQELARLDDRELWLQLKGQRAQLQIKRQQLDRASASGQVAQVQQEQAAIDAILAGIELLEYRIERAIIRAPIAGHVLSGYWRDKLRGVIEQGDVLFEIAPLKDLTAILRVDESDINQIHVGQIGQLATRSNPEQTFTFTVTRIVPQAIPVDRANVVEVHAAIEAPAPWLRPGMQGLAKVDADRRRIYWLATHRIADWLRLYLWW